jgi:hypothetical protein
MSASTAREPVVTSALSVASVGSKQMTDTIAYVIVPAATLNGAEVPEHASFCESVPDSAIV